VAEISRRCTCLPLFSGCPAQEHVDMAVILFLLALAVLGPLLGADSRDGRDWQPGFWEPGRLR